MKRFAGPSATAPQTQATVFRWRLRVYWEDTDAGGVVFYANYLKYFERARTEWLRAAGHSQQQLRSERQVMFIVTETRLRYLLPARLDDLLEITVVRHDGGRVGMGLAQQAWRIGNDDRPEAMLCEGEIRIACVDAGTFRPCRIPNDLLDAIE